MKTYEKVLITGGAGFLGSHLCKTFLEYGSQVTTLDNLTTGQTKNIDFLSTYKKFSFIKHDIINPINLDADLILNFACPASPPKYQNDPIQTIKTNILGSINMLELAKKNNCRILQASTSEIYGNPSEHPQTESYCGYVNPIGIRSCYDEGKRCAETLFFDYARQHKLDIKVIRIFNTYGSNMCPDDGRVVSNFIVQALKNKPITIYGNGSQTRSLCYVTDLIDGIIKMAHSASSIQGPINLGNTNELSMNKLAEIIISLTKSTSKIVYKNLPKDDPLKRKPNTSLAKQLLQWESNTSITSGLQQTISYFKALIKQGELCNEKNSSNRRRICRSSYRSLPLS